MKYFYSVWIPYIEPRSRRNSSKFVEILRILHGRVYRYTAASTAPPLGCEVSGEELEELLGALQDEFGDFSRSIDSADGASMGRRSGTADPRGGVGGVR